MRTTHKFIDAVTGHPSGNILQIEVCYVHSPEGVGVDQVPTIKTVDYQGRKVRGEVVGFTQAVPEAWNEYNFSDGSSLRMRSSLLEVVRLLDEYGPNGDPIYVFTAQQLANITAAENLKQVRG